MVDNISHMLRKHRIECYDEKPQEQVAVDENNDEVIKLCFESGNNRPWIIQKDPILKQNNSFACAPIAYLKVMELYGWLHQISIEVIRHSPYGYHGIGAFFYKYNINIHYLISKTRGKMFKGSVPKTANDGDNKDRPVGRFKVAADNPEVEEKDFEED